MNRKMYIDDIFKYLARFELEVQASVETGLFDNNIHAENVLIPILNSLFHLSLRNTNAQGQRNFPAIDLCDDASRVAFQVSSTGTVAKVTNTIETFHRHSLGSSYDILYVLVLGKKPVINKTSVASITKLSPAGFCFEPSTHIVDFSDLRKKVMDLQDIIALHQMALLLQHNFSDAVASSETMGDVPAMPSEEKTAFSVSGIETSFEAASLQLSEYGNTFEGLNQSHIVRTETNQIVQWITGSIRQDEEPVHLLVGEPGSGKSVILRDCYEALTSIGWTVLAFKADCYRASSLHQLYELASLPEKLEEAITKLLEEEKQVAILIDQIDAVVQSVISERGTVDTYGQLIHRLKRIDGIRIVVSIRRFELEYDSEFASYKRKYGKTDVLPLSRSAVMSVLAQLQIREGLLNDQLYDLLKLPTFLNVFCKIHHRRPANATFHSELDLFEELWRQKVSEGGTSNVEETLLSLVEIIRSSFNLTISRDHVTPGPAVNYLIRSGLIVEQGSANSLQFFHQTFYEYVFARSFSGGHKVVISHLKDERQSLLVRASFKMILRFYRQLGTKEYGALLKVLLTERWVRWHIRLLALNHLGFQVKPTATEISLAKKYLLDRRSPNVAFIESIHGAFWFKVLMDHGTLDVLASEFYSTKRGLFSFLEILLKNFRIRPSTEFTGERKARMSVRNTLLRSQMSSNGQAVLRYLLATPDYEGRQEEILRLLMLSKEWATELGKKAYTDIADKVPSYWWIKFSLLEEAADYDPCWTLERFRYEMQSYLEAEHQQLDSPIHHEITELSKKLAEKVPEQFFLFLLDMIRDYASKQECEADHDENSLFHGGAFMFYDYKERDPHGMELLFSLVLKLAQRLCKENNAVFGAFIRAMLNSRSPTMMRIALRGLEAAPEHYIEECYSLLGRLLKGVGSNDSHITFLIRELLPRVFPLFGDAQKQAISWIILGIKVPFELEVYEQAGEKKIRSWFGHQVFEYLSAIPASERETIAPVKRRFAELVRKFGSVKNEAPNKIEVYSPSAPMSKSAYENMTMPDWEASLLRYNKDYRPEWRSRKGGMEEHARTLKEKIKEAPAIFISLIESIFNRPDIEDEYKLLALEALKEAKYKPDDFLALFKKLMHSLTDSYSVRRLIWLADYLSQEGYVDEEVFAFLVNMASTIPKVDEIDESDPEQNAFNSVAGSAVYQLMACSYNQHFISRILDVLESLTESSAGFRISVLMRLAYFLQYDYKRVVSLFCKLVKPNDHPDVYRSGINTAQYIAKEDFETILPFLMTAITHKDSAQNAAIILSISLVHGEKNALPVLEENWPKNPDTRAAMIDVSLANYVDSDPDIQARSKELYCRFLDDSDKAVVHEYSTSFLHMKVENFGVLLPLLKTYSMSRVGRQAPGYFLEYLFKCCYFHPKECLDLVSLAPTYERPDITSSRYYEGHEPIRIVVAAYNALLGQPVQDGVYIDRALSLFDELLKHPVFRKSAEVVTAMV